MGSHREEKENEKTASKGLIQGLLVNEAPTL